MFVKKLKLLLFILIFININTYAKQDLKKVTLQLSWFNQFQFAGYYMAKEKGFYEELGLDVEIKPFNFDINIPKSVSENKIDFAVGRETLILEKINNKNKLVLLYALFQSSPLVLISKENSNINSIKEFKNKRLMTTIDDASEVSLKAMISSSNVETRDLKLQKHSHNINDLIDNKTDIISAYISKAPFELKEKGIAYNLFEPKEYGFDMYSDFLYTNENLISKDIRTVQAFKRASLKGWEYAYSNIEESSDLILDKYNTQNLSKKALLFEAKELKKISYYQTETLGKIKKNKLQRIYDLYKVMGLIKENTSLENFILEDKIPSFVFTKKELEFLSKSKEVLIGTDKNWTPYVIESKDKILNGYDKDILDLINKISGTKFTLVVDEWKNITNKLNTLKIDGISTSVVHKSRENIVNFSDKYFSINKMIITTKENPSNIRNIDDLNNKTIAVLKHNLLDVQIAKGFKKSKILFLDTSSEVVKSLVFGKADAVIGGTGIFYYSNKLGLPYLKPAFVLDEKVDLVFSIRKELPEAVSIINKALAFIGEEKLNDLQKKWFWNIEKVNYSKLDNEILLNEKELDYIANKKSINICISSSWLPFSNIDSFGNYRGINADIINLISTKTDINFIPIVSFDEKTSLLKLEAKVCDISTVNSFYKDTNDELTFSSSYLKQPLVIATRTEEFFIKNSQDIGNKKVGIVENSAILNIVKQKYPNMNIVEVKSARDGLKKVNNKSLFGYIDLPESIDYNLKKNVLFNLKISGKLDVDFAQSFALRNDEYLLRNIFEKLIKSITLEEKQNILNSWLSVKFEKEVNYDLIWQIVGSFIILIFILIIFFIKQNKLRNEIIELNRTLENRVREEVEKNREKDNALFRQSKLASMGEMIGNIAHQWRQPLNRINLSLSVISVLSDRDELDKKIISEKVESAEKNIKYMSETIEDFINFFKPDKKKTEFLIIKTLGRSMKLLEGRINDIKFTVPQDKSIKIRGYENEFLQVLLIILNNAIDNFNITNVSNKKIHISLVEYGNNIELSINDNSGGIEQKNLEKIFEPYFTTKFKKEGTGIGLYMAKMLVEKSMHGKLNVSSINKSSTFVIKLKKYEELEDE